MHKSFPMTSTPSGFINVHNYSFHLLGNDKRESETFTLEIIVHSSLMVLLKEYMN